MLPFASNIFFQLIFIISINVNLSLMLLVLVSVVIKYNLILI